MNSVYGKGPVSFNDITCLGTPTGFGVALPQLTYYVKKEGGSDSNNGRSWKAALKTYQAGVTLATRASNRYKDVDLIIAPAEYDEQVVVSGEQQGIVQGGDWYGYRIGRLRIIHMGVAVVLKNSTLGVAAAGDESHTLLIQRSKVELYGGIFRNYTASGDFSAVCWERALGLGDVIQGAMHGCKVEGRNSAQIGIDIDAAQYVEIDDCWISGFDTGILVAHNSLGSPVETLIKSCRFRDNTDDILLGQSHFTLMQDNIHMDEATTQFVGLSDYTSRSTGNNSDCLVVGARLNTNSPGSGKLPALTGVEIVDTKTHDR